MKKVFVKKNSGKNVFFGWQVLVKKVLLNKVYTQEKKFVKTVFFCEISFLKNFFSDISFFGENVFLVSKVFWWQQVFGEKNFDEENILDFWGGGNNLCWNKFKS